MVATTGRRGDVPAWLDAHGITVPETVGDAGVVYFSRFYRSDHDEAFGFRGGFGAGLIAGVIGADAGTYSITAVVDRNDKELRRPPQRLRPASTRRMRLLPELADVAAADGVPIHPVHCMTGLINRTRSFTDAAGTPLVARADGLRRRPHLHQPGLRAGPVAGAATGDLHRRRGRPSHDDLLDAARAYEAACAEQVAPWYHFSVLTDQMRAAASGGDRVAAAAGNGDGLAAVFANMGSDPEMLRLVMRVMNLLELPQVLIEKLPEHGGRRRPRRRGREARR